MNLRNSEISILNSLEKRGYVHNMIISGDRLYVDEVKGKGYAARECVVELEYRFEGLTNPSDMSIVYAISTRDDHLGTAVVGYGASASTDAADFFRSITYADQG